jgi:hypothetical protein
MHRRVLAIAMALPILAAACGGSGGTTGTTASSAVVESPMPAGTYSSTVFQPTATFTLPGGWVLASDSAGYMQLRPANQDVLGIHLFRGVTAASQDPSCPTTAAPGIGTTSTELVKWIRGLEGLTVSSPALVTVGGLHGSSIDVGIADGWTKSCPFANGVPAVPLFVDAGTALRWVVSGGERLRLYLLDLPDGGTLIVDVDDFEGSQFSNLLGAAAPIVKSLSFATK